MDKNDKNRFLYYFLAASLLFHLLAAYSFTFIPWEIIRDEARERLKEPLFVDILGPLKHGEETRFPKPDNGKKPTEGPVPVKPEKPEKEQPKKPDMIAKAAPPAARPAPPPVPVPRAPEPRPQPAPAPEAKKDAPPVQRPSVSPEGLTPAPKPGGQGYAQPSPREESPSGRSEPNGKQALQGTPEPGPPRRLVQPTVQDLMRYAKVDPTIKRAEPEQGITLDTTDLMYTSYMQGLKNRIEMIWKYPDTAQRDGLQGELVMRFTIVKSGRVENVELIKSSGYQILDQAAKQALIDASPFNPLPDNWKKEEFVITGTFIYQLYGLYIR